MPKLYWSLWLLIYSSCNYAVEIQPYIVNGSNANIVNYPSFASLFYRSDSLYSTSSYCGATMINSRYVLTAAHCIYGDDELMLHTVVAPQLEDESNFLSSQQAKAKVFYYLDSYVDSASALWRDDIAIIELETALAVSDYTSILNSTINNAFSDSDEYKAVGHGYIEGNVAGGTQLLQTDLTYISTQSCQSIYGSALTSSHLCFTGPIQGGYRNSTCNGDSGGPVYWYNGGQYIQIGITSFGPATCGDTSVDVTSVFTDIHDYQEWIGRVINGQEVPKAYVVTSGDVRTLINNDSNSRVEAESTPSQGSESSGGAFGLLSSFILALLLLVKHPVALVRNESS
ncbi:serine protease [Vibrio xuii]|nr:serine protease [Vibrio xuii]